MAWLIVAEGRRSGANGKRHTLPSVRVSAPSVGVALDRARERYDAAGYERVICEASWELTPLPHAHGPDCYTRGSFLVCRAELGLRPLACITCSRCDAISAVESDPELRPGHYKPVRCYCPR